MKHGKIFLSSFLALTLFSCKKLLDIPETDLIGGEVAFSTVANCEQGVIGAYAGIGPQMAILLNSTFSDEVKKSEFYNAGTTHEWQYGSTDVGIRDNFTAIDPNYQIVDRANRVLRALPTADSLKAGDNTLRVKLRGEALFLRAYAHFELVRYYGGAYNPTALAMPYMEEPSLTPTTPYERITMAPYFEKLAADIAEAKDLLPDNLTDKNRANRLAAAALQARIALYSENWAAAEGFASEYIAGLPLATAAEFPGIWKDENTTEVAFQIVRTATVGTRLGSLWRGVSSNAQNIGTVTWQPSDKLWNSYDQVNDIRFPSYFKVEPILAAANRPARLINKYAGSAYGTANENVANAKIFRTGEMFLIRAEARAEQPGKLTGANSAESDINQLRAARIAGYTDESFGSKEAAIAAIMLERFRELPFEGHRFWDLKRRGLPVQRDAADAPTTTGTTLPANDYRFVLPIPLPEIQSNAAMEQNPGY
ncbi:MAG: RagB/SusD family nutrient uptake outer membrane protein [Chitinophagaceae bacterium]|nr:MAG: RagB/SusD family nutrient uptake outer membrane protein [Chitinophagaceae bacterium]